MMQISVILNSMHWQAGLAEGRALRNAGDWGEFKYQ